MTPRVMTGTATYARSLLVEFSHPETPVDPVVIVNNLMVDHVREWLHYSVDVHRVRTIPLRDTATWRLGLIAQSLLLSGVMRLQVPGDLVAIHYPLTLTLPSANPPKVLTLHDVQHHDQPQFFSSTQRRWRHHAYDMPAKSAAVVITVSEHAKSRVVDRLEISPERVEVIYHGVDHSLFRPMKSDDSVAFDGIGPGERFILYPAALWAHKNHEALIDALALLEDSEVILVLTGPTLDALDRLMERARRRAVDGRVRHLGFVSSPQLAALYRQAEALVFPSLYEGFGAPPLEAMASGCVVAASREGSLAEICGDAAATFDARDPESIALAVDQLLADAELRRRLRARGLTWARSFTWQAAAEQHVASYRRAAELAG